MDGWLPGARLRCDAWQDHTTPLAARATPSEQTVSETYASAREIARAFGSTVLEPSWWPTDVGEISYSIDRGPGPAHYRVCSTRRDRGPICVIGRVEDSEARRSPRNWLPGEWHEPVELARVQGLIGSVGIPPRLQAFVYDEQLRIVLIGYDTEDEIISVAKSLRRVGPH